MSRVELITEATAPLTTRKYFEGGDPGPIVASLAQVPELVDVSLAFIGTVLNPSSIGFRVKEMVIVRTSAVAGCKYCVNAHTMVARDAGLSRDEVCALRTETPVDEAFNAAGDQALLAWVDAVAGSGPIPEHLATEVKRWFSQHELVELTLLVSTTLLLNRYCTALELPTDTGTIARLTSDGFAVAS